MKLIIDIPEERYEFIKGLDNTCYDIHAAIAQGIPYEEKPKYFPPCEDCNRKMEEIRQAYDKMKAMERPQGDLISREELKEAMEILFKNGGYDSGLVLNLIDNAPTVDAVVNTIEVRPLGKWIIEHDWVHCSSCGHEQNYPSNFCSKCGAEMRGNTNASD